MKTKLRILHIWNTGGVASILAKFMDRIYGTKSDVIMRKKCDPFGLTTYGEVWDAGAEMFILRALLKAREYDLVHVHALDKIVPLLKALYPFKPIVLQYHGNDIRGKWKKRKRYWSSSDAIIVSTPDLLQNAPEHTIYLPNPVDTDLFRPLNIPRKRCALFIVKKGRMKFWPKLKPVIEAITSKWGIQYDVMSADATPISYHKMPILLNSYEYYLDIPHGFYENELIIQTLSKTGLEALACGTKVIIWSGEIIEGLPAKHRPETVVKMLWKIYESLAR